MSSPATTSSSRDTGSEVLAYCGSCKMDLAAIIVAKVGPKIARVQCKTCKKEHTYKAPKGVTTPAAPAARGAKRAATEEAEKRVSLQAEWTKLMAEANKVTPVTYSPKSVLQIGEVIDHSTFGKGIVMKLTFPDKAQILFQDDLRTLIHSRK